MANPPILFPDASAVAITYTAAFLLGRGDTAAVHHSIPNPRPSRFVLIFRTGGPRHDLVTDGAQLTIECWADTEADAADLAQLVRAGFFAIAGDVVAGSTFYGATELAGPVDLPDPASNQSRQTWTIVARIRGTELQPIP